MTTATLPLDQVAKQIAQQETELTALRREYTARKTQLGELTSRQQRLQAQLNQVESQIQALTLGSAPTVAATTKPTPKAKPHKRGTVPPSQTESPVSLHQLLVTILREAGRPQTTRELADEVRRRAPGRSGDLLKQVMTRVGEQVKKGVLRRTPDQKAVTLANSPKGNNTASTPDQRSVAKTTPKAASPLKRSPAPQTKTGPEQPLLRVVLMSLLKKSPKPLTSGELAKQVLATGYQSSSKDFSHVVHVMLTKLDDLEKLPGQGYRLKKR